VRVPWLADVLRAAGVDVYELPGWKGRGAELAAGSAGRIVVHHTATPPTMLDGTLDRILRDGRSDLPGPLAQAGPKRSGSITLVADGKANHNGYGTWRNDALGWELANDGRGEPYSDRIVNASLRSVAAVLLRLGRPADRSALLGHKETDPGRKIDPVGINMDTFRANVGLHMLDLAGYKPATTSTVTTSTAVIRRGLRLNTLRSPLMRLALTFGLDDQGRAWLPLDGAGGRPRVPFGDLISVRPLGSNPAREGYWPIPETAEQNKDGVTLLTVEGGAPGGTCTLYLVVPDA
jgi:hypothetical protein